MFKPLLALLLSLALAGCTVGPKYSAPAHPALPPQFRHTPRESAVERTESIWWSHFGDPVLNQLIAHAQAENLDLAMARARLDQSRAKLRRARWDFGPTGEVGVEFALMQAAGSPRPPVQESWAAVGVAAWELDLFGRQRHAAAHARALVEVAAADLRGARVAVSAEVASSYLSLRAVREIQATVTRQYEVVTSQLQLAERRVRAGQGTVLEVLRLTQLQQQTEVLLPSLAADEAIHLHRLAVLLGENPTTFQLPVAPVVSGSGAHELAIGSPTELLRRRPDVAAAERRLAAATAQLGVSTAAMLPQVSVQGALSFVGLSSSDVGDRDHRSWAISPQVSWSIFDLGRLDAARRGDNAGVEAAAASYRQVVLRALQEVEDSLAVYNAAMRRLHLQDSAQATALELERIARLQQEAGAVSAFEALEAQRAALASQRELLASRLQAQLAVVAVYRAFAGGWEERT